MKLYGEEMVEVLELENRPIKKFTIGELEELEAELKDKIKLLGVE